MLIVPSLHAPNPVIVTGVVSTIVSPVHELPSYVNLYPAAISCTIVEVLTVNCIPFSISMTSPSVQVKPLVINCSTLFPTQPNGLFNVSPL